MRVLIDAARESARAEAASAVQVHHVLLACTGREGSEASRLLRESGWRDVTLQGAPKDSIVPPERLSPELTLHLAWVAGLRAAQASSADVVFVLSCLVGPTSVAHDWLQWRGVDLDALCNATVQLLGLDESICRRRTRWSTESLTVAAADVTQVTETLRADGRRYRISILPDGSAVVRPEEERDR